MNGRILVVEDDRVALQLLVEVLKREGHEVRGATGLEDATRLAAAFAPHVVITDMRLGDGDGLELLRMERGQNPAVQVIVVTAFGSLDTAVEAIRHGAFDYVSKPFRMEEMCRAVARALEARSSRDPAREAGPPGPKELLGRSAAMTRVFTAIARVAPLRVSVLIEGETGTGKEMVAQAIHARSERAGRSLVAVNCVALPETLLESELFGHVKGSFTGAVRDREGLFAAADGGTVFLDEIGDMPLEIQAKLLRVLESGEIRAVGATRARRVDVRVLAATNRDLLRHVEDGRFRQDLYYRLNTVSIHLPPLRERAGDLDLLADDFLRRHARDAGRTLAGFSREARELLRAYSWPGNVRELSHVVARAVALAHGPRIEPEDLPTHLASPRTAPTPSVPRRLDELEQEHILAVLRSVGGNRARAAALLGIDRKTLYRKLLRYGIERAGPEP